jgi:hypothetical protein
LSTRDTLSIQTYSGAVGHSWRLLRAALLQVLEEHRILLAIAVAFAAADAFVLSQSVEGAVGNFVEGFPYVCLSP